jgi:hypothetical protein
MSDAQFIAELLILIIGKQIVGFDQDTIDSYYADYEEPLDTNPDFKRMSSKRNLIGSRQIC